MPYKIVRENKGFYREYSGIVTPEDIINSNNEYYEDLMSDETSFQIINFSGIHKLDADKKTIQYAIAMSCGHNLTSQHIKVACVIRRSEIILSIAECIKELIKARPNWSFRVFESIGNAREWAYKA